ncbi:MAG: hypothetical protein WCC04_10585 [Terriglobales bacterium]
MRTITMEEAGISAPAQTPHFWNETGTQILESLKNGVESMSAIAMASNLPVKKKPAFLTYFLGFVFVLFIGILIFTYVVTKRTNPVMLDQYGKPVSAQPAQNHAGH